MRAIMPKLGRAQLKLGWILSTSGTDSTGFGFGCKTEAGARTANPRIRACSDTQLSGSAGAQSALDDSMAEAAGLVTKDGRAHPGRRDGVALPEFGCSHDGKVAHDSGSRRHHGFRPVA